MIPKKHSDLYTELSEELDVPVNLIENLIDFCYKDLKTRLVNLEHPRINMLGLGQFVARPSVVKRKINIWEKGLVNHDVSTMRAYHNKRETIEKLEKLKRLDELIEKEKLRKKNYGKTN